MESSKYVIQTLQDPPFADENFKRIYDGFAKRILWMDGNVVPGAFQMNTAWYFAVPEKNPIFEEHSHNTDELIGFIGSNPDDPYDLGGELEVTVNGETHVITTSTMIFAPAGMPHMPLKINRVDRPIFHFSVVMESTYDAGAYK
ncbi:MAG: hypothetical protein Q4E12_03805 [Coriobacteriia bacterium]|nr:hypothetical protein [Coriobacteriia bacterium]